MKQQQLTKQYLIPGLLFIYQSGLDLKRSSIEHFWSGFQDVYFSFMNPYTITGMPIIFLMLYIIHRAVIHGVIVRLYTQQKNMLQHYMLLDMVIVVLAISFIAIENIGMPVPDTISFVLIKLLNTPLLLLFFLPVWYITRMIETPVREAKT